MCPMNSLWNDLAARANLVLTDAQHAQFSRYLDLLVAANERMNLTRITVREAAEVQHVGDSLTLLPFLPAGAFRLVDVGSGGGVPGIPLAIARPDATVLLVESTKKKAVFLEQTAKALGLQNVTVSQERAEDVGQSNLRETFDIAVARAVATLDWLAEWLLPLVRKGGKVLAMKGERVATELPTAQRAIKFLGGGPAVVHPIELPGTEHRVVVYIPKMDRTDSRFPRPATRAKGKSLA
jgi:16S rRNA (guanine527-N7)-methyltransferase